MCVSVCVCVFVQPIAPKNQVTAVVIPSSSRSALLHVCVCVCVCVCVYMYVYIYVWCVCVCVCVYVCVCTHACVQLLTVALYTQWLLHKLSLHFLSAVLSPSPPSPPPSPPPRPGP